MSTDLDQAALPVVPKATASDVKDALHRRYCGADLAGTHYVCIEEARSGAGFDGNNRQCDFLAVNTFKGRGMELIGHEVKVSLSDWKTELADPTKAEEFARYCRRWWIAVPSELARKIKNEVPAGWGLLSLSDKGRWTEAVKAPTRHNVEPVPVWWWIGWLAQIDRQTKKRVPMLVSATLAAERDRMHGDIDQAVERRVRSLNERHETTIKNAAALKEATGIDLPRLWPNNLNKLRQAWALVESGYDIEHLSRTLRSTADALDGLTVDEGVAS